MNKGRLEAFSDAVMAVITIMVLELRAPHSPDLGALLEVAPPFLSYLLSFTYIAIYWNNHHHMFQAAQRVDGSVLWVNNLLLLCLSLIPFTTDWMGENHFQSTPVAVYGVSLLLPAIAFYVLQGRVIHANGPASPLAQAIGADWKGRLSPLLYIAGIALAPVNPIVSEAFYVVAALWWLVPDRRIERRLMAEPSKDEQTG